MELAFSRWKVKKFYIFASETCALDIIGASFVREVENGEIIVIENNQMQSLNLFHHKNLVHVFEYLFC